MQPEIKLRHTMLGLATAALFLLLPLVASAQQTTATSNTITGRVVTASGEPLGNGAVYVMPMGTVMVQPQSAKVDSGGNFKTESLDAGLYRVWANVPGFVAQAPTAQPGEFNYYRPGDSVTLTVARGAVITGIVTGSNGPAVATMVRALRVRDADGKALPSPMLARERATDDRGIYRLYGLPEGAYLIAVGGQSRYGGMMPTSFDGDSPTYFPSSTRDTASEVVARSGEDTTADIQYRAETGRAVSGTVTGVSEQTQSYVGVMISLTDVRDRSTIANTSTNAYTNYAFSLDGVPDGEYELSASQTSPSRETLKSEPRRIKVRGADVTSIKLTLSSQAGIEGRLLLENDPKADCGRRRDTATQETLILARRYEPETKPGAEGKGPTPTEVSILAKDLVAEAVPDAKGSFTLRNLAAGPYLIDPRPPASGWFLRSITLGPLQSIAARNAVARDGVTLKSGERLSGLIITVSEGAASVRGRVTVPEGQRLPAGVRVYLVPVEKESAADVLRFFEGRAESDGSFVIGNIAPGKYWLVTRPDEDPALKPVRRDSALRSVLLRDAEKSKSELTLKPCERMTGYELPFAPSNRQD